MSNGTNWTPGPWRHTLRHNNDIMTTFHGVQIGRIYIDVTTDNEQGDAHLIAAAPCLYEALVVCLKSMETGLVDYNPHDEAAMDKARSALAKARGEQS